MGHGTVTVTSLGTVWRSGGSCPQNKTKKVESESRSTPIERTIQHLVKEINQSMRSKRRILEKICQMCRIMTTELPVHSFAVCTCNFENPPHRHRHRGLTRCSQLDIVSTPAARTLVPRPRLGRASPIS